MIYQTAPYTMMLNNPSTRFKGNCSIWRWMYQKLMDVPLRG